MKYEKPEMDILLYDVCVALTTVSGMEYIGPEEGDESDLPL